MKKLTIAFVIIAAMCAASLADKKRDWQEGKLIDIVNDAYAQSSPWVASGGALHRERISYVIDTGKYIYVFSHLHMRQDKAMQITVNTIVKFAIEKNKVYLMDENGEEHDLKFEKKALKEPPKDK